METSGKDSRVLKAYKELWRVFTSRSGNLVARRAMPWRRGWWRLLGALGILLLGWGLCAVVVFNLVLQVSQKPTWWSWEEWYYYRMSALKGVWYSLGIFFSMLAASVSVMVAAWRPANRAGLEELRLTTLPAKEVAFGAYWPAALLFVASVLPWIVLSLIADLIERSLHESFTQRNSYYGRYPSPSFCVVAWLFQAPFFFTFAVYGHLFLRGKLWGALIGPFLAGVVILFTTGVVTSLFELSVGFHGSDVSLRTFPLGQWNTLALLSWIAACGLISWSAYCTIRFAGARYFATADPEGMAHVWWFGREREAQLHESGAKRARAALRARLRELRYSPVRTLAVCIPLVVVLFVLFDLCLGVMGWRTWPATGQHASIIIQSAIGPAGLFLAVVLALVWELHQLAKRNNGKIPVIVGQILPSIFVYTWRPVVILLLIDFGWGLWSLWAGTHRWYLVALSFGNLMLTGLAIMITAFFIAVLMIPERRRWAVVSGFVVPSLALVVFLLSVQSLSWIQLSIHIKPPAGGVIAVFLCSACLSLFLLSGAAIQRVFEWECDGRPANQLTA